MTTHTATTTTTTTAAGAAAIDFLAYVAGEFDEFAQEHRGGLAPREQRLCAVHAAAQVLELFELARPGDTRPRDALEVARRYALGEASLAQLREAWAAAKAASDEAGETHGGAPSTCPALHAARAAQHACVDNAASAAAGAAYAAYWSAARAAKAAEGFRRAGDRGEATVTRDGSVALAGARGAATVGHYGMARTGAYGRAAAGHHSVAVAGVYGNAVAGDGGTAIVGHLGTGAAGAGGALVFSWVDREGSTRRSAVVIDGEKFIPGVMYRCEDDTGEVVPA